MGIQYRTGKSKLLLSFSHRDIKPENFMLAAKNDSSCVKLIDFGLSKDYSGQPVMSTPSGSVSI
jgi:serine/threonine protein kinase